MKSSIFFLSAGITLMGLTLIAAPKVVDLSKLPPPSTRKDVMYDKDIKGILDNSCVKCHGGEKAKAKLHLDTLAGAIKGSHDGKVIEPGTSAKSQLVLSVGHLGPKDGWMPPLHNKANIPPLTTEQIGLICAWIDQGAK
jgi:hypothetical protein